MTYNLSLKRRIQDLKKFNWEIALEVLRLHNQGWTYEAIGDKLGLTRQRVHAIFKAVGSMTVEEAELGQRVTEYLNKLPVDNTNKID